MIRWMFEVCIGMLKFFNKIQYVSVDLLTDADYDTLKKDAKKKAEDIAE